MRSQSSRLMFFYLLMFVVTLFIVAILWLKPPIFIYNSTSQHTTEVTPLPVNTQLSASTSTPLLIPTLTPRVTPIATPNSIDMPPQKVTPAVSSLPTPSVGQAEDHSLHTDHEVFDVVIIGSEIEGLYLARAAVDEGLRVKILDPREGFGGQLLQAEMFFLDEVKDGSGKSLLQGRVKKLFDGFKNATIRKKNEFESYVNQLTQGIPVESHITIRDISPTLTETNETQIDSMIYLTKSKEVKRISAKYWVDNTDHAALLSKLNVTRLPGLETVYGQTAIEYMSAGLMMKFKNVDWAQFQKSIEQMDRNERNKRFGPAFIDKNYAINFSGMSKMYQASREDVFLRGLNAVHQRDGEVLINALLIYKVDPSDLTSIEEAISKGSKEIPLILEHFRRSLPGWEQAEMNGIPAYPYIREYNHYEMEHVLKPSDLLAGKMFWDNVSIGGYPLDLQGISSNKWGIEMGRPDKYGMPLRSFLLKNYDNVLVTGKNVGSSAIAYGSTRIQPNTSIAAETIGIILGQINKKKQIKQLTQTDMLSLHRYIETKYSIKLMNVPSTNKLIGWTEEELQKLDQGKIVYPQYILKKNK